MYADKRQVAVHLVNDPSSLGNYLWFVQQPAAAKCQSMMGLSYETSNQAQRNKGRNGEGMSEWAPAYVPAGYNRTQSRSLHPGLSIQYYLDWTHAFIFRYNFVTRMMERTHHYECNECML